MNLLDNRDNSFSGFYLHDHENLYRALVHNEIIEQPTLLIGVTFALMDFAEKYSMKLEHTIVMETGGMKGRREEITRGEVHEFLKKKLGIKDGSFRIWNDGIAVAGLFKGERNISLSALDEGVGKRIQRSVCHYFKARKPKRPVNGLLNIIDLANLYSCSFIATDDVGKIYKNESFEVLGRLDVADMRGCSLMTAGD